MKGLQGREVEDEQKQKEKYKRIRKKLLSLLQYLLSLNLTLEEVIILTNLTSCFIIF